MYLYVKFISDEQKLIVPLNFIKNFESLDVANLQQGCTVLAFWSSDEKWTPTTLLKHQGFIHDVDNLQETKKGKKSREPISGYYKALVLMFAGTYPRKKLI